MSLQHLCVQTVSFGLRRGQSALHVAAAFGHVPVIRELLVCARGVKQFRPSELQLDRLFFGYLGRLGRSWQQILR